MSLPSFHLSCFVYHARPPLNHPAVTIFPAYLGQTDLQLSFSYSPRDDLLCATAGRLWESLLDEFPDSEFLMLRVADMRATLGSKATALQLYQKLQAKLNDAAFGQWLAQFQRETYTEVRDNLQAYLSGNFSPSQRWRPETCESPFPYCKLPSDLMNNIRADWTMMGQTSRQLVSQYLNYHALETLVLEGTVQFDSSATQELVRLGFYNQVVPLHILDGQVRTRDEALAILQDTRKTLDTIFEMNASGNITLTAELVTGRGEARLAYVNVGITRAETMKNVFGSSRTRQGLQVAVQYCPYYEVKSQLETFCRRFNELLRIPDMDPFAAAAWISHVFVTIHPFEDGNGRLSRILASIPLMKKNLPPICIAADSKLTYYENLNQIRAEANGDYSQFMMFLFEATQNSCMALYGILQQR